MSRKTMMATALAACLAVLFFAVHAADRNRRLDAERTQRGPLAKEPAPKVDLGAGYVRELDPVATDETWDEPDNPISIEDFQALVRTASSAQAQAYIQGTADQLLRQAQRKEDGEAISLLRQVLDLKLDASAESKQILSTTHQRIAALLETASRKQYHLQRALQHTADSDVRARIEADIIALGGSITLATRPVARDYGLDDQCTHSIPVGLPGSVTMSIEAPIPVAGTDPIEDTNFVSFDIPFVEPGNPHQPLIGAIVQIETTGACSSEAECSSAEYDTLVRLWGACASDGFPELRIQGDDDGGVAGDSGLGWLSAIEGRGSCIDETGKNTGKRCFVDSECQASQGGPQSHGFCNNAVCLPAGTYYIEAIGEFGSSPQNFSVSVRQIGTCPIPRGDSYEADNAGIGATKIGWPHSIPGNGNGRANKEIQGHTILAAGTSASIDTDNIKVDLSRSEMVKFSTAVTQPRPNNGYFYRPASQETDTQMHAQYADGSRGMAGLCNHNSSFRLGSWVDLGCYSSQTNFGIPGLGPDEDANGCVANTAPRFFLNLPSNWCVPNNQVAFLVATASGTPNFFADNPFTFHDDNNPGSADFGSTIELCLPASAQATQSTNPVVARITSSAANPRSPLNNYFYEARGQTLTPCNFEQEPNSSPFQARPIALNSDAFGIGDNTETRRTNVVTPIRGCVGGTAPNANCYASPRQPGPNRFPAILDVCPGGGTCTRSQIQCSTASPGANAPCTLGTVCANGQMCRDIRLASAITIGGFHDLDWWSFDVAEETDIIATLTPKNIDPQADTELFLRVGPADTDGDGFDDFPIVVQDADEAVPVSRFEATIVPAAQYLAGLGIPGQNPTYFFVAAMQTNRAGDDGSSIADWYYTLSFVAKTPFPETEPNNDCLTTTQNPAIGEAFQGSLSPSGGRYLRSFGLFQDCDIDAYRISVTENTRISFFTEGDPALTDTAIQLENCDDGQFIACDEDGQYAANGTYWSILEGCLPPGNYCVRVRAWSGLGPEFGLNEFYKIKFKGTAGCDPSSDPVVGDGASSCRVGGSRGPFDTFCDGDQDGYPAFTACGQPRTN